MAKKKDKDKIFELQNDLHESENERLVINQLQVNIVRNLRAVGASWADIGKPLFMSRQAAQQFYGPLLNDTKED